MNTIVDCLIPNRAVRGERNATRRAGVVVAVGDQFDRIELACYLAHAGFDVWTAGSGLDALTTYATHTAEVDVLLIDAGLRDLPGAAFLARLRAHFPDVPCVFLTDGRVDRARDLVASGATVLPREVVPEFLAGRLAEAAAFGLWRSPPLAREESRW